MGIYSEYVEKNLTFEQLVEERKRQLKRISVLRGNRDILVYASDWIKNKPGVSTAIDFSDKLPFEDQLSNLKGSSIDIILETPGGFAEVVEDMVRLVRSRYEHVGIIIPGTAKSAGTIFTMAGDEILMGPSSALGPIDAQIQTQNGKQFSAEAFLEGLEKIKQDIGTAGRLHPAYIPILQNISPGEIQHCENAQNFSQTLVTKWLSEYKFKYWEKHSSTGLEVTKAEKEARAREIAGKLCKHSEWLTHSRSINIDDLLAMRLVITNYSQIPELNDAIVRYYTLLRMTFDNTNMYKLIESTDSQIYRFSTPNVPPPTPPMNNLPQGGNTVNNIILTFQCPNCQNTYKIQAILDVNTPRDPNLIQYPKNDIFVCPNCGASSNIGHAKLQIEAQTKKKIIL